MDLFLYHGHEFWLQKGSIRALQNQSRFVSFRRSQILQILSTIAQDESLKIQIRESQILTNPDLPTPDLRVQTFDLHTFFQKIRIVDLICKSKNLKLLDSFRFGRIRIQILQAFIN